MLKKGKEDGVLKLKKAMHGLKRGPRALYFKLDQILSKWRFLKTQMTKVFT